MLKILEPGMLNSIQDAGRWGYQALGVPVSGAMDTMALRTANNLVRNAEDEAAIEIHSPLACETDCACLMALTGADASIIIDGRAMPMWTSVFARAGSLIEVKSQIWGWNYLAIHGGIDVPRVMGSKSTYMRGGFGGFKGRALEAGDEVIVGAATLGDLVTAAGRQANHAANRGSLIRVMPGPHREYFTNAAIDALTNGEYVVTESADRMGYRLRGSSLARRNASELVSCGVPIGALQVPSDGQPIVLMADHQTTGGYPIIAVVITQDIPLVAQTGTGKSITFRWQ